MQKPSANPTSTPVFSGFHSRWILSIGFVLLWNSGFIGAEYALPFAGPFTLLFWRYWFLAVVLLLYHVLRGRTWRPGIRPAMSAALVGMLSHGCWQVCVLIALGRGVPAGIVALAVALQPMMTGALSGWAVGEATPLRRWRGLMIGLAGVVIAVMARANFSDTDVMIAYLLPFVAAAAMTAASLLQRRMELEPGAWHPSMATIMLYQSMGTALAATLPALWMEGLQTTWTPAFAGALIWLIGGVSLGAYILMWMLIRLEDATRVASLFYLGPPVTMCMAWIAFGDSLLPTDLLGLAIVIVGIWEGDRRPLARR